MGAVMKRRTFLSSMQASLCLGLLGHSGKSAWANEKHIPFFDQYFNGTMSILSGLKDTQLGLIENEMMTAYGRGKKGATIYSQISSGHFPIEETAPDRIGQPNVMEFLPRGAKAAEYSALNSGDMVITNTINLNNFDAMDKGVRVVAVTVNYYPFAKTPPGEGYQIEREGKILKIEDTANVTIDSQIPWDNGLVNAPQCRPFPVLPGGGLAQAAVYWLCAAELAGLKANRGDNSKGSWAEDYIDVCLARAEKVGRDRAKYAATGKKLAELVLAGAAWHVFGSNHALVSDAVGVANGPMITRRYKSEDVKAGDIVMIGAYTSNHAEEVAVARDCRKKGAYVVAITPFETDDDSSGDRLYKEVDAAFNTYSPESWGVVDLGDGDRKVCPTTGVIGDLVMWLIMASWMEEMVKRDAPPYFWKGFFMKHGRENNDRLRPYFIERGY